MPKSLISITAIICEKILVERDRVLSAIRIVDLFFVDMATGVPPEKVAALLSLLVSTKFSEADDQLHSIEIKLLRPDGEIQTLVEPHVPPIDRSRYPGVPTGFNLHAEVAVSARQLGLHAFIIYIDGEEAVRTTFTLLTREEATS
jgi:hypothetical protein